MTAADYDLEYTVLSRRDAREETALKERDAAALARLCCPVRLANDLRALERIRRDMEAKRCKAIVVWTPPPVWAAAA